ncbi:MAG: tetratricopeptide repeat protein [Myxococcota bacterium]
MTSLLLRLALAAEPDAALQTAADAWADDPFDPARRRAFVQALAEVPGREVEAIEALRGDPTSAEVLAALLARAEPRPAWAPLAKGWPAQKRYDCAALLAAGKAKEALGTCAATDDRRRAALAALVTGEIDKARAYRDALPELAAVLADPTPAARAQALVAAGHPALGARVLESARRTADDDVTLGTLRLRLGSPVAAEDAFRAALAVAPDHADARAGLARALLAQGRPEDAAAIVGDTPAVQAARAVLAARATEDEADDADALAAAWRLDPGDPEIALALARRACADGRLAEAYGALEAAATRAPADPELVRCHGRAAMAAGRPEEALRVARLALGEPHADGVRAKLVETLVQALLLRGETGDARVEALVALALLPEPDAPALRNVGGLLWRAQELEGAYATWARAVEEDPSDVEGRLAAASLAFWTGRRDIAEALLAPLDPALPKVQELRAQMARRDAMAEADAATEGDDPGDGERRWRLLAETSPDDVGVRLGLANALSRNGKHEEALEEVEAAARIAPDSPWPAIAEANVRLAMGELDAAREALAALPDTLPKDAATERDRARARALRAAADLEREAGRLGPALVRYAEAAKLDPNPWTLIGLAALYAEHGQPQEALALYEQVAALPEAPDPQLRIVAERGRAGVLEALGRREEALVALDALVERAPTEENVRLRDEVALRVVVAEADDARRGGELDRAQKLLERLNLENADSADVHAALAAVRLDEGDAAGAVNEALRALQMQPAHAWALDTIVRAGPLCGCTRRVVPYVDAAAAGGDPFARAAAGRMRVAAAVEEASALAEAGRRVEAKLLLQSVEPRARKDADAHVVLARGYAALGQNADAIEQYRAALAEDPAHRDAALELSGQLLAAMRPREAEDVLLAVPSPDEDVTLALARARLARGKVGQAERDLDALGAAPGEHAGATALRAQIGGASRGWFSPAFGMLSRTGMAGVQKELALFAPVGVGLPRLWAFHLDLEVVPVAVTNDVATERGVAPSVAMSTPTEVPWSFAARVGTSPIGFAAGAYPVWSVGGRWRPGPRWQLGLETARVPLQDSLASWAGARDALTGELYGSTSLLWGGAYASFSGARGGDLGWLARGGVAGALGMEPNPHGEAVVWLGRRVGTPDRGLRFGIEGVGALNQRQADGFRLGEGAYYSPPQFGLGQGRIDARWHASERRLGVCLTVAAGALHATGEDTPYFAAGTLFTHQGRLAAVVPLGGAWRVDLEGGWLAAGRQWHQEVGLVRIGVGRPVGLPTAASALTTFAMPGQGIVNPGEPC